MKLATDIHLLSANFSEGLEGQRSKSMTRPNACNGGGIYFHSDIEEHFFGHTDSWSVCNAYDRSLPAFG